MATEKADDQRKPGTPTEPQFPQPSGVGGGAHGSLGTGGSSTGGAPTGSTKRGGA